MVDLWGDRPAFALDADVTVYWPDVRPCWEPELSTAKAPSEKSGYQAVAHD